MAMKIHFYASRLIVVLAVCAVCCPLLLADKEIPCQQHLFKIERAKNANIIQYDVQHDSEGLLDKRRPVTAYWIRLAEEGQKMDLRMLEKKFAYGFNARYNADSNTVDLRLKAKIGRGLKVMATPKGFRAQVLIRGQNAWLEKIFIKSSGKGLRTKIEYYDLYGIDSVNGEDRFERITP